MCKTTILSRLATAFFVFLLGLANIPCQAAAKFTYKTLDVPGAVFTEANGNTESKIVGDFDDANGNTHGFIYTQGKFFNFDVPRAVLTTLNFANDRNQYTGNYLDGVNPQHGFFLDTNKKTFTTLDPLGSTRTQAAGLNNRGQVIGVYRDGNANQKRRGFIWQIGKFTSFNVPGDDPVGGTVPFGINDHGQIVGDYVNASDGIRHGFLLSNGVYTTFDPPNATLTVGETINNKGQIVGVFLDANGQHGFLLDKGVYTTIDFPDSTATSVFSIDNEGTIVGSYDDINGVTHGFIGKPADD